MLRTVSTFAAMAIAYSAPMPLNVNVSAPITSYGATPRVLLFFLRRRCAPRCSSSDAAVASSQRHRRLDLPVHAGPGEPAGLRAGQRPERPRRLQGHAGARTAGVLARRLLLLLLTSSSAGQYLLHLRAQEGDRHHAGACEVHPRRQDADAARHAGELFDAGAADAAGGGGGCWRCCWRWCSCSSSCSSSSCCSSSSSSSSSCCCCCCCCCYRFSSPL